MKSPHVLVVLFLLFFEACSKPADKPRCRQQVLLNSRPGGNGPGTTNPGIINSGAVNLGISSSGTPSPTAPSPGTPSPSTANSNGTNPGANPGVSAPITGGNAGSCPGFKNVVFNTVAPQNPGFPGITWPSLAKMGVQNWIGFSLQPLDQKDHYNIAKERLSQPFNDAQIHMVVDDLDVEAALTMLKTDPPSYLALLNEPDYSWEDLTRKIGPDVAGRKLSAFFPKPHPSTKYLSPATAFAGTDAEPQWLQKFHKAYPQYFDEIDIISYHCYEPNAGNVLNRMKEVHTQFPKQKIWITELAPNIPNECTLPTAQMKPWLETVFRDLQGFKNDQGEQIVQKIFWNHGEHMDVKAGAEACNPSLTDSTGNVNDLGKWYGEMCSGGAPVAVG